MGEGLKGPGVGLDPGDLVGVIFRIPLAFFFLYSPSQSCQASLLAAAARVFLGHGQGRGYWPASLNPRELRELPHGLLFVWRGQHGRLGGEKGACMAQSHGTKDAGRGSSHTCPEPKPPRPGLFEPRCLLKHVGCRRERHMATKAKAK